jgi:aerobic-type carbon monoxide dehydrogenase small subunit (CoxS/CutS family)
MVMSTLALLRANPEPSDDDIGLALAGNLCRCTGYQLIFESVHAAAQALR